ncbi:MAG: TnpV protein [Oscillospiraceae bacterium]|nr:TnpV protein [Oscillospiraceae bacterium]
MFELTYSRVGDYWIPYLTLPEEDEHDVELACRKFAVKRRRYIKNTKSFLFTKLLTTCKLTEYLANFELKAEKRYGELVGQLMAEQGLTNTHSGEGYGWYVRKMYGVAAEAERRLDAQLICA